MRERIPSRLRVRCWRIQFWPYAYTEQVSGLNYFLVPVLQSFSHMVCFDDIAVL
jgi:hypothetical protein